MTLKPLIALTVIHQSIAPGVAATKEAAAIPPKSRVVQPFKKTGMAFMAMSQEQQDELVKLGCVAVAPEGTPLDPESAEAEAGPVVKAVAEIAPKPAAANEPAAEKPKKAPAKKAADEVAEKPAETPAAPTGEDTGKGGDDSSGLV